MDHLFQPNLFVVLAVICLLGAFVAEESQLPSVSIVSGILSGALLISATQLVIARGR